MGFFDKLKKGMGKTKSSFDEKISNIFKSFRKVDEDFLDELEEILIMSDIGMDTSVKIINNLRNRIKKEKLQDEEDVKKALREEMKKILELEDKDINLHLNTKPSVVLISIFTIPNLIAPFAIIWFIDFHVKNLLESPPNPISWSYSFWSL